MTVFAWLGLKMAGEAETSFTVQVPSVLSECSLLLKIDSKILTVVAPNISFAERSL